MPISKVTISVRGNGFELSQNVASWRLFNKESYEAIKKDYRTRILKAFNERKSGGIRWAPNKPKYLRRKIARGYGRQPLIRTGQARRDFLNRGISRQGQNIRIGINHTSSYDHVRYNLLGTSKVISNRKLPLRDPLLNIITRRREVRREVERAWSSFLRTQFRKFLDNPRRRVP